MSTIPSIARRLAGVTLAALAAVTLTACDSDQIGAAAVVGGERITVEDLQAKAQEIVDIPGSGLEDTRDLTQLQRDLLGREILARVMRQAAEDQGLDVTDAQVDDLVAQELDGLPEDQDVDAALAQSTFTLESFREAARTQLIAEGLTGEGGDQTALVEAVNTATDELGVEVNPRYGEWGENFAVEELSGSISTPADGSAEDDATETPSEPGAETTP